MKKHKLWNDLTKYIVDYMMQIEKYGENAFYPELIDNINALWYFYLTVEGPRDPIIFYSRFDGSSKYEEYP